MHSTTLQVPGVYRRRIGDHVVTALSDGFLDIPYDALSGVSASAAATALRDQCRIAPPRVSVNAFLIETKGRIALVDTGAGDSMGPTLGWLRHNLAAAGVAPTDIDTVLLTHAHPDHSNGILTHRGADAFPMAKVLIHEHEIGHWCDDAQRARANERDRVRYFQAARRLFELLGARLATFRDGEVFPGVLAMLSPGHTPGHSCFLIRAADETLLIWGDTVHVPEVQVARPDVSMVFDTDAQTGIASRRRVLEMAFRGGLLVAGMHFHFPGFGYVRKRGEQYRIVPEAWSFMV